MSEIKYMVKPDWISWDEVQECQRKAHEVNNVKGFHMKVQDISGEELKNYIGDGICIIALDGEKVVGTTSIVYKKLKTWWGRNRKSAQTAQ